MKEQSHLNNQRLLTELNSIVLIKYYNEFINLPIVHDKKQPLIRYFEENNKGDDFIVGDIHCQFKKLDKQLKEIGRIGNSMAFFNL